MRKLELLVLAMVLGAPQIAKCDLIFFREFGGTMTVTRQNATGTTINICDYEFCRVTLSAPDGMRYRNSDLYDVNPGVQLGVGFNIAQPGTNIVLHTLGTEDVDPISLLRVDFVSAGQGSSPFYCGEWPGFGCPLTETGAIQEIGHVTWMDYDTGVTSMDIIRFQADVPEPTAILLLATAAGLLAWRSRAAAHFGKICPVRSSG